MQGYLALKEPPPSEDPTVALCLGTHGDLKGSGVFYERGIPVHAGLLRDPFAIASGWARPLAIFAEQCLQGYLAHKKQHSPLGTPQGPRLRPTVGSKRGAVSHQRGTLVHAWLVSPRPTTRPVLACVRTSSDSTLHGKLHCKKTPTPLGPPQGL